MASVCSTRSNPGPTLASDEYYNNATTYNPKLDARHVDVADDDETIMGQLVKFITSLVGNCFSPQLLIVVFRLLKAITFCCLCAVIVSEFIFVFLVEVRVSADVLKKLGGTRDQVIRCYGIFLAFVSMFIELDMSIVDKYYYFMKSFLPRSCLLFFITFLSGVNPIIGYENHLSKLRSYDDDDNVYYASNNNYGYGDDNSGSSQSDSSMIASEVSTGAVAFQSATTFFLFLCASAYFVMGILCLDRFTSDAFLADDVGFDDNEERSSNNFRRQGSGRRHEVSTTPIDIGGASFDLEYSLQK